MKKIYSFLLIATALLISTNMWAEAIPISTADQLSTYFNRDGIGDTYDLQLTETVTVDETLRLYAKEANKGNTINLDLNGKTITFSKTIGIELFKGTLNITGSGYLTNTYQPMKDEPSYVIMVYGYNDENTENWSNLTIGENVNIQNEAAYNGTPTGIGVAVDGFHGAYPSRISLYKDPTNVASSDTIVRGELLTDIYGTNPADATDCGYWRGNTRTTRKTVAASPAYVSNTTAKTRTYNYTGWTYTETFALVAAAEAISSGLVDYATLYPRAGLAKTDKYINGAVGNIANVWKTTEKDSIAYQTSTSKSNGYTYYYNYPEGLWFYTAVTNGTDTLRYTADNETSYPSVAATNTYRGYAYGVVINVSGTVYGSKYGVKVNGYLIGTGDNAPKINLTSTSAVEAAASSAKSVAVYSSGFGSWTIEGEVTGANGVYVKSGEVEIENATITSNYEGTPANIFGKSAGVDVGGMAICIESNDSYAGGQAVTISGDTKVSAGENGAAILEKIATKDDESKVSNITINGGTFEGGQAGSIIIEDDTKDVTTVYGANIEVVEGGEQTATDIQNLLEQLKPAGTTVVEVEVDGQTTYVVTEFTGTTPTSFTISNNTDAENRADFDLSGLDLSLVNDFTVGDEEGATPEDIYLGALILNHTTGITINVYKNSTLTVKSLVMGENDVINVAPGAKLIVDGEQGITAPKNENIIVKAVGDEMGEFYFNPAVNSNKHPKATVELNAKAYNNGSTYYYQRCGVPAFEGIHPSDIQKSYGASYWYWDAEADDWINIPVANWSTFTFQPFQGFQVTSAATAEYQETYNFPVALYGNVDGRITYRPNFNYMANSYTGGMDIATMLADIMTKNVLEGGLYAYTPNANTRDTWDLISALDVEDANNGTGTLRQTKLDPMQAFVCRNKTAENYTDTINYKNVVWNHRNEAKAVNHAPARRSASSNWDKVKVVVISNDFSQAVTLRQSAQFSSDYDNGGDITVMENGEFNVYAETELGNLAQVATDNLVGQTLTIDTKNVKSFKMTFENVYGQTFAIRDNVTGSVIDMTEDAEYYFTADADNGANRFEIVAARKMPTDVETINADAAAKAQKGIYSLVGAYLGENFDVLPAGVYVVNGVKVVK